jgi:Uma2 family endonuclease
MVQQSVRMTADELFRLPDDGHRYELVRGELRRMAPAGGEHGERALSLGAWIFHYVRQHRLGRAFAAETGFQLRDDPDSVRAPDVAFVRRDRLPTGRLPSGYIALAPDLAVEIVSPSETAEDVEEKVMEYLQAGTALVWLVYSRTRTVVVRHADATSVTLQIGDILDGEDVIPGFRLPLSELFSDEPSASIDPE